MNATEPMSGPSGLREGPRPFVLEVLSGPEAGQRRTVEERLRLGSDPGPEGLRLSDASVSRAHAEVVIEARGARVTDLGSLNGTFLASVRTSSFLVRTEATFRLGRTSLRLSAAAPSGEDEAADRFGAAVTAAEPMRRVFAALRQAAASNGTIVLTGETGTGKQVLAEGVHQESRRRGHPFVVIDCGAVSGETIESELFGHVKGAFTGAVAQRTGLLASADGGTVFLDEVNELPLELQPRLLRFLMDGTLRPVGGDEHRKVDVRVVAATHKDLRELVDAGRFRADLYYRLCAITIHVPPLRDRPADVNLLFRHFLAQRGHGDFVPSPELLAHLSSHRWPGNVRELRNVVEQVLTGTATHGLEPAHAPQGTFRDAKEALIEAFTRQYFSSLYRTARGNVSEVARLSGVARPWVHELLKRLEIHTVRPEAPSPEAPKAE